MERKPREERWGESSGRWGEGGPLTAAKLSGDYKTVGDSHGCSATRRGLLPVASMIRAVAHSHPQRPLRTEWPPWRAAAGTEAALSGSHQSPALP